MRALAPLLAQVPLLALALVPLLALTWVPARVPLLALAGLPAGGERAVVRRPSLFPQIIFNEARNFLICSPCSRSTLMGERPM